MAFFASSPSPPPATAATATTTAAIAIAAATPCRDNGVNRSRDAVNVSWNFVGGDTITSTLWVNLMTLNDVPSCGYEGYTQAYVQGGGLVPILQTEVATTASGTFTWNIVNHAYQPVQ